MEIVGDRSLAPDLLWSSTLTNMRHPIQSSSPLPLSHSPCQDAIPRLSNALVRSESVPSNLFEANLPDFNGLSARETGFQPVVVTSSSSYESSPRLSPLPTRSLSSVELTGVANVETLHISLDPYAPGSHASSNQPSASSTILKSKSSQPRAWHKSVFDMIQDDFPRTPAPMLSSVTQQRSTFGDTKLNRIRRSRLASSASLDVEFDHLQPLTDVHSEMPRYSRTHRRSASVNWTGSIGETLEKEDIITPRHKTTSGQIAPQQQPSAQFSSSSLHSSSSMTTVSVPKRCFRTSKQLPRSSSSPHSLSPSRHLSASDTLSSQLPSTISAAKHPAENLKIQCSTSPNNPPDRFSSARPTEQSLTQDQSSSVSAYKPRKVFFRHLDSRHHGSSIPRSVFDRTNHEFLPPQSCSTARSTHIAEAIPDIVLSSDASSVAGARLCPLPYANSWLPTGSGLNPIYASSLRDSVLREDELNNMNAQMAAFMTAHQQLYAAQMAAIARNTSFHNHHMLPTQLPSCEQSLDTASSHVPSASVWEAPNDQVGDFLVHRDNSRLHRQTGQKTHIVDFKKTSSLGTHNKNRYIPGRRGHRVVGDHDWAAGQKIDRVTIGNATVGNAIAETFPCRSTLLEEFRTTSLSIGRSNGAGSVEPAAVFRRNCGPALQTQLCREWELSEIIENVVEFATDQHGSRFIQQKLESASEKDKQSILRYALVHAHRLMTDVFGNYVVQKLLDYGGRKAIKLIACELEGRMLALSLHMYGCRVVQKALEVLNSTSRAALVRELDGHVLKCIRDQNGNHVIQKCVELVEPSSVQFLVNSVHGQAVSLAGHSYGCRVVQRILEYGAPGQKAPIMMEIMSSIGDLIKDQYGNYVIQHVVEHGTSKERSVVLNLVRNEVFQLSKHKFASNVVERCLQFGSQAERYVLVAMLIGSESSGSSPLDHLVRDQFGNYVVQRVLDVALTPQREQVVSILRAQVPVIKKYSYGKHIISRLELHQDAGFHRDSDNVFNTSVLTSKRGELAGDHLCSN